MTNKLLKNCSRQQRVVDLLEKEGQLTTSELADEMDMGRVRINVILDSLRKRERVESDGEVHRLSEWGVSANLPSNQKTVIRHLGKHGECTVEEISKAVGIDEETLRSSVNRLEKQGLVESRINPLNPKAKLRRVADGVDL